MLLQNCNKTTTYTSESNLLEPKSRTHDDDDEEFFEQLPLVLRGEILSFLDVPSLGACSCVSKQMNQVATCPRVWYPNLKCLLRVLVLSSGRLTRQQAVAAASPNDDDDDQDVVTQLMAKVQEDFHATTNTTTSTDSATAAVPNDAAERIMTIFCGQEYCFERIMQDHRHDFAKTFNTRCCSSSSDSHLGWIMQKDHCDLHPRDYYKQLGSIALWAIVSYNMEMARVCHCTDCDCWCLFDCRCVEFGGSEYIEHCIFRRFQIQQDLPHLNGIKMIRLFRTPPDECHPRHKKLFCRHFTDLDGMLDGGTDEDMVHCIQQWEQLCSW